MGRRFPHRVTIQTNGATEDSIGQEKQTWSDERTVWAHVVPIGGDTKYASGREISTQTRFVELQHDPDNVFDTTKRIQWTPPSGTKNLYPEYVMNAGERDRMLVVRCREEE